MSMLPALVRVANAIAAPVACALPLRYEVPNESYKNDFTKITTVFAMGVGFWIGLKVANDERICFREEVSRKKIGQDLGLDRKNFISLLTSLGIGAVFLILNTPRIDQLFQKYYHVSLVMRGIAFGYMSEHVREAWNFHDNDERYYALMKPHD